MRTNSGMTLIELMIVVAIVAILASIAYPSYMSQVQRSHRAEAKQAMLQIQVAQERYYLQNNSYGTLAQLASANIGLVASGGSYYTANKYYKVTLPVQTATNYTAQADAYGAQTGDTACLIYTVDQTGTKTPTTGNCWSR